MGMSIEIELRLRNAVGDTPVTPTDEYIHDSLSKPFESRNEAESIETSQIPDRICRSSEIRPPTGSLVT
jgi:hypothetical protein